MDVSAAAAFVTAPLVATFLAPGSIFSLASLAVALVVAASLLALRHWSRRRRLPIATLLRVLFPPGWVFNASSAADVGLFLFNVFLYASIFGGAILSYTWLSGHVDNGLSALFGTRDATPVPDWLARALMTLAIFLAYELGYWVDHYISHRVGFFWEFHRVHHTATVLTPWTAWRVHPFDTLKFYNILAVSTALANGVGHYLLGRSVEQWTLSGNNLILVGFVYLYIHLQHTQVWIAFRGLAGRIFLSPAHHQIHHSSDSIHFNRNFGSCLAIWDWVFGTLYVPARHSERLVFGVAADARNEHAPSQILIAPVHRALARLWRPAGRVLGRRSGVARRAAEPPIS